MALVNEETASPFGSDFRSEVAVLGVGDYYRRTLCPLRRTSAG